VTEHREYAFETHHPVELYVENGKGYVEVRAADTTESHVRLDGPDADEVRVDLAGRRLSVVAPQLRGGFLGGGRRLDVVVTVPIGSDLVTKLGSADLQASGPLGAAQVRSGSGDVTLAETGGPALLETGSGDVRVERAAAPLRVKSGSGDVEIGVAGDDTTVSTGSGDVHVRTADGPVAAKTGSGDLRIGRAATHVGLTTGSGDLQVDEVTGGRVQVKGASGDVRVGVPAGLPVWTDVKTVTGRIRSTLQGAGQPEPGAPYVELLATTVSGDILLTQL
jgi:DUF4097 and DUF4098 domain-containing protein YvlB